jgi:hypothetical protein
MGRSPSRATMTSSPFCGRYKPNCRIFIHAYDYARATGIGACPLPLRAREAGPQSLWEHQQSLAFKSCARASGAFLQLRIVMPGGDPRLAACCVPINDFPVVRHGPLFQMIGVVNFLRPVERPVHGSSLLMMRDKESPGRAGASSWLTWSRPRET